MTGIFWDSWCPKKRVAKSLIVDPSSDPAGGDRFAIEFGPIANASNANATILYYGTTNTTDRLQQEVGELRRGHSQ